MSTRQLLSICRSAYFVVLRLVPVMVVLRPDTDRLLLKLRLGSFPSPVIQFGLKLYQLICLPCRCGHVTESQIPPNHPQLSANSGFWEGPEALRKSTQKRYPKSAQNGLQKRPQKKARIIKMWCWSPPKIKTLKASKNDPKSVQKSEFSRAETTSSYLRSRTHIFDTTLSDDWTRLPSMNPHTFLPTIVCVHWNIVQSDEWIRVCNEDIKIKWQERELQTCRVTSTRIDHIHSLSRASTDTRRLRC